uniref:Virulence factor SrfB n=1 Tax=Yoonia rhodophyticola TaxID=3137370 RepID=A0AAN0MHY1_9RHOB
MFDKNEGLADLPKWQDEVTIVPFSGIQILDFGFKMDDVASKGRYLEKTVGHEGDMTKRMLIPLPANVDEASEIIDTKAEDDPDPYTIDQERALAPFLNTWVPVPVLRIKRDKGIKLGERYDPGPTSWARVRVTELEQPDPKTGHTHRVHLALDTMLGAKNAAERFVAPDEDDVKNPREFRFVSDSSAVTWFLSNPQSSEARPDLTVDHQRWVSDWVRELFIDFKQREAAEMDRVFREDRLKYHFEHWSRYLQFLATVDAAVDIPKIRFLDTVSPRDAVPPVEVDLVLDIGNSRTCGIFIERFPDGSQVDLTRSFPLQLRDLSRPEFTYSGLIESRVEFADLTFGKDRYASLSGRGNGFLWPSFVRVGPEAQRLTQAEMGTETTSGLSSPKRYLWDTAPTRQDWRFHNHTDPNNLPRNARAIMLYLNEAGDELAEVEREIKEGLRRKEDTSLASAIRPRFSRSSVYTFMLCELISQALIQINDPAGRLRRYQTNLPRRLSRIILTLPTATPVQEQKIIRSRTNAALSLVWKRLGIAKGSSNISIEPELIVEWDEASCTQLVYLYSGDRPAAERPD